ncbi:MAG: HAD-IIA family hydrolase [Clostridia bacterium]|nr:HAD-IIA family hydrolase [Clostridia bacterium]
MSNMENKTYKKRPGRAVKKLPAVNDARNISKIECFLFDMDGTLYLGNDRLDGAKELIDLLRAQGKKALFITNNSSRVPAQYVENLAKMDISATVDDFFTSADAIVYLLNKTNPGARIYVVGTPGFENFMADSGFELVRSYETDPAKRPEFVVLGFDTTLTYEKLRIMCDYLVDGVRYVATHPDMVCPAEGHRFIPDAGSMMLMIEGATGRKPELIAGKPNATMINILCEKLGVPKDRTAVVGDRLNTDIMSGINAGAKTVCVLSGETNLEKLEASGVVPDYIFDSVLDIYNALR